jgi:hypothetical protein
MLYLGGLGSGYIVRWDEPRPLDQTDLKRQSRCDVESCCNALREGEEQSPREEAGRPTCGAGWPSSGPSLRSGVLWCLLESSSVGVRSVWCDLIWFLGPNYSPEFLFFLFNPWNIIIHQNSWNSVSWVPILWWWLHLYPFSCFIDGL